MVVFVFDEELSQYPTQHNIHTLPFLQAAVAKLIACAHSLIHIGGTGRAKDGVITINNLPFDLTAFNIGAYPLPMWDSDSMANELAAGMPLS